MRNITKLILKSNKNDIATTPTGYSIALIDDKNRFRNSIKQKIHGPTSTGVISNAQQSKFGIVIGEVHSFLLWMKIL